MMTRKYSLVIDGEPGSYSAYVPELPTIVITGETMEELTARASEAIQLYFEVGGSDPTPATMVREIEVELPA